MKVSSSADSRIVIAELSGNGILNKDGAYKVRNKLPSKLLAFVTIAIINNTRGSIEGEICERVSRGQI